MTSRDFCYWLQGYIEISKSKTLTADQMKIIKNHLSMVFVHEIDEPDPTGKLHDAHDGLVGSQFDPNFPSDIRPRC